MISVNGEWKATEDVLEMDYCINHCQQFLACDTIVPRRLIQGTTVLSNNPLSIRGQLREYSAKACVASVRVKDKWQLCVWCSQHWILIRPVSAHGRLHSVVVPIRMMCLCAIRRT